MSGNSNGPVQIDLTRAEQLASNDSGTYWYFIDSMRDAYIKAGHGRNKKVMEAIDDFKIKAEALEKMESKRGLYGEKPANSHFSEVLSFSAQKAADELKAGGNGMNVTMGFELYPGGKITRGFVENGELYGAEKGKKMDKIFNYWAAKENNWITENSCVYQADKKGRPILEGPKRSMKPIEAHILRKQMNDPQTGYNLLLKELGVECVLTEQAPDPERIQEYAIEATARQQNKEFSKEQIEEIKKDPEKMNEVLKSLDAETQGEVAKHKASVERLAASVEPKATAEQQQPEDDQGPE